MPKIRRVKTYPFPFLAEYTKDYKKTKFALDVDYKTDKGRVLIEPNYQINNEELNALINDGVIKVIAKIVCPKMGLSRTTEFAPGHNTTRIYLQSMEVDDDVEVSAFIVAARDFTLTNPDLSDDWINENPAVQTNNVLGESNECVITMTHVKKGSSRSIFKFTIGKDKEDGEPYSLSLDNDDAIVFKLTKKMFNNFNLTKSKGKEFVYACFIIPALVDILRQMKEPEGMPEDEHNEFNDRYSSKKWYQVLTENYSKAFNGADPLKGTIPPIEAAQILLERYAIHNVLVCGVQKVKGMK